MTVVFPTENDKDNLIAYIFKFHSICDDNKGAESRNISDNFFKSDHIIDVECACNSVLSNLRKLSEFFTPGRPLGPREIHDTFDVGNVESFSSFSLGDAFSRQSPSVFLNPYKAIFESMRTEVVASRDTLRRVNSENAFIWTTNMSILQQWPRSGFSHTPSTLKTPPLHEPVEDARRLEGSPHEGHPYPTSNFSRTDGPAVDSAAHRSLSDLFLLSLNASQLPSERVKNSYARFIQVCGVVVGWLNSMHEILHGLGDVPMPGKFNIEDSPSPAPEPSDGNLLANLNGPLPTHRTRTITVRCFEIHDTYQIYALLVEQAGYFFQPACTQYDPRIQRRLLQSSYFHSVRDLIDEITLEIRRLSRISQQKPFNIPSHPTILPYDLYAHPPESHDSASDDPIRIFIRPSLSHFYFLRSSLQFYLSFALNEDDYTSAVYFRHLFQKELAEAKAVVHSFRCVLQPSQGEEKGGGDTIACRLLPSSEAFDSSSSGKVSRELANSRGESSLLDADFEAYRGVRARISALRRGIERDIHSKDITHRTRVLSASVREEKGPAFREAEEELKNLEGTNREDRPTSFWTATKYSFEALSRLITCKGEVEFDLYNQLVGKVDGEGIPMTTTSPCHDEKTELLKNITQLWEVIEIQGRQLEKKYPNLFFRGNHSRWFKSLKEFAKTAEAVSTVFEA
ncbi:unnamed protein product [Phytomonas sp. Hart1]|nr:unnamed protein product [Phytomonas sp. Hart1]|eukprot:CCW71785.1 unnamed protein product [Phytomonas sp. isolate Hart1]